MAKMEKINCAAIKRSDNIIIAGRNHAFVFQHSPKDTCGQNSEQGFITSNARFVDRTEAADIAFEAGQIKKPTNVLFSEDITGDNPWAGEIIEQLRTSHAALLTACKSFAEFAGRDVPNGIKIAPSFLEELRSEAFKIRQAIKAAKELK